MKEFLQSIFQATHERVKNPFIGAFMTSWVLFNWKPILFIIFSSKNIEEKIKFIDVNFIITNHILWYPLFASIFYVLILPYVSLLFDILLKYSLLKRNDILVNRQKQNIENQKQLAIEEIKLETAKTDFREKSSHNKLVEDLQMRNADLETEIQKERDLNRTSVESLRSELADREKMLSDELQNSERRYYEVRKDIQKLTEEVFEKEQVIESLKRRLNNGKLIDDEKANGSIITFGNGLRISRQFNGGRTSYVDSNTGQEFSSKAVEDLMNKYPHSFSYE